MLLQPLIGHSSSAHLPIRIELVLPHAFKFKFGIRIHDVEQIHRGHWAVKMTGVIEQLRLCEQCMRGTERRGTAQRLRQ